MIVEKWNGHNSTILQKDVIDRLVDEFNMDRAALFNNKYLDVENVFRKAGWTVRYDSPAWNADNMYEPTFRFSKE